LTVIAINPATRKTIGGEALPVSRQCRSDDHALEKRFRSGKIEPPTCPRHLADPQSSFWFQDGRLRQNVSLPPALSPIAHAPKNQCGVLIAQNG